MSEKREKFDIDGEQLLDGRQVALVHDEGDGPMPVLRLKIVDLQEHTPMIRVQVLGLLQHESARLFTVGETFEAAPWYLSVRDAAPADAA
jgi:hypothetical protein